MTMKYTPEPWEATPWDDGWIRDAKGVGVCMVGGLETRDRIVACVNGCAGINPEAVPDMLAALETLLKEVDTKKLVAGSEGHFKSAATVARAALAKAKEDA